MNPTVATKISQAGPFGTGAYPWDLTTRHRLVRNSFRETANRIIHAVVLTKVDGDGGRVGQAAVRRSGSESDFGPI